MFVEGTSKHYYTREMYPGGEGHKYKNTRSRYTTHVGTPKK